MAGAPGQREEVAHRKRTAGDREPVDDRVLLCGQLAQAIAEELLERRGQPLKSCFGALAADELMSVGLALADFERSLFEERVHHLEQEERVTSYARDEIGAYLT